MRSFVSSNPGAMTRALAHRLAEHIRIRLSQVKEVRVAFSAVQSLPMFTALSRERLDWARVTIMMADDNIVPTDSYDSHNRLIRHTLLRGQAAAAVFEPINVYGGRCSRNVGYLANSVYVQPDIVVLGMHADGRLGLITGDAAELESALSGRAEPGYVVLHPRSCRTRRISLNLAALLSCRQIFLSVSGTDNLSALKSAAQAPSPKLPISLLIHQERVAVDVYRTSETPSAPVGRRWRHERPFCAR